MPASKWSLAYGYRLAPYPLPLYFFPKKIPSIHESYYPPFPWCSVNVYDLSKTKKVTVRGYIDTGSDGTIVIIDVSKKLGLHKYPVTLAETVGISGKPEVGVAWSGVSIVAPAYGRWCLCALQSSAIRC